MDEPFDLPVMYKGEEQLLPAQLVQQGYTHKFEVLVHGTAIYFEPDEEGNYRALVDPESIDKTINLELLQAIAAAIEKVLR